MNPRARYETDFGGLIHRLPEAVITARRDGDVADACAVARDRGLAVTIRGAGHSCAGQTLSDGLVIVNAERDPDTPAMLDDERVEIQSGARWRQVESFLMTRGRSVPVLADYLDLSVGGTLSVGGYGADSIVQGPQVDHVESLQLILPDGRDVRCSPTENSDLFGCALGGLGQFGLIERVVLRTVPYRPFTALFTYRHRTLAQQVVAMKWLAEPYVGGPLMFKALYARGRFVSTYGVPTATFAEARRALRTPPLSHPRPAHAWVIPRYRQWRSRVVSLWLSRFHGQRRLWADYFFDYGGLQAFTSFLAPLLGREPLRTYLKSLYVMAVGKVPRAVPLPLEATNAIDAPVTFGIGLYSMIPAADLDGARRVADVVRACLEQCARLGGRPYRYGWHEMDDATERAIYGRDYDLVDAVRRRVDPDGLWRRRPPSLR